MAKVIKELPNPDVLFLEIQSRLTFGVKAAAHGCGISVRQLDWWTRVGYVPVIQSGRHRRYSADALKIALLIKHGLAQGMSLRRAAEQARGLYPFLWDGTAPPADVDDSLSPNGELESIRSEVSRLSTDLSEIGKRMDQLLGLAKDGDGGRAEPVDLDDEE